MNTDFLKSLAVHCIYFGAIVAGTTVATVAIMIIRNTSGA